MILIGIGSNLAHPPAETPLATATAALIALSAAGIEVRTCSAWHESAPVPPSSQPWFANGVAVVASELPAPALLAALLAVEADFGRVRGAPNAARTLDLDLLDYDSQLWDTPTLILPHPRLHQRRFVLEPLSEIAPQWRHPKLGRTAAELLAQLPSGQMVRRIGV